MWFWLALASAVLGSVDVILNKKVLHKVSSTVFVWAIYTFTLPLLAYLVWREGVPVINSQFFLGVFGSSLIYIFAKTITSETLKQNLVSKILPLTAFNGVFTYLFALLFLSESIRLIPLLGLLSVVLGSYVLNLDKAKEDFLKPFKLIFLKKESIIYLLAIMLGSVTSTFDKLALKSTSPASPIFTVFIEQIILSIMLSIYMSKNQTWAMEVKKNFGFLLINSINSLVIILLVFNAYDYGGPVALVVGVRRLQIFLVLLMGYLFFKDKPTKHVWIATAIMVLGVLLIKLG